MSAYQPKTGHKCHCRSGIQRDNCTACEGTGWRIDFAAIRAKRLWEVKEGTSRATVRADDHSSALARASEIGFSDPDSVVLSTPHQRAWVVSLNGRAIDTVFYTRECDAEYVRNSLVEHDNYDPRITVREQVKS